MNYFLYLLQFTVMAATKEPKPSYHAVGKKEIVGVDRKCLGGTFWVTKKSEEQEFDLLIGQKDESPGQVIGNHHRIEDEFRRYLKEVGINFRRDDPMVWSHELYFPQVAKLARRYLAAIPASTAPSERVLFLKNILQKKITRIAG